MEGWNGTGRFETWVCEKRDLGCFACLGSCRAVELGLAANLVKKVQGCGKSRPGGL